MKRLVVEKTICCLLAITFPTLVALAQNRGFTIQVASSPTEAEARSVVADLKKKGLEAYWVKAAVPGKGTRYRVRVGRYKNQLEAKTKGDRYLGNGSIKEFIVTVYDTPSSDSVAREESRPKAAPPPSTVTEQVSNNRSVDSIPESKPVINTSEAKSEAKEEAAKAPLEKLAAEKVAGNPAKGENALNTSSQSGAVGTGPGEPSPSRDPNTEPAIATPAVTAALSDVTINNNNWKVARRTVETDKNLRAIYFVDSMTGWAAGDAGAVYRTTDGGRNWKPLLSGAAANINFIYFIDWNHGWMLGESGGNMTDENESENVLLLTTNGGRTWTRKPLPNVTSLYFANSKTGWAVGKNSTLLKTTDGGLEWSKVESMEKLIGSPIESSSYNFGFSDIHFTSAEHGWLIGNFYGRARSNIGGIFATSDGGATWKRVPITFQTQHTSGRFTPGLLHSVRFTDTNTGSVTGEMYDGDGRFFFALHTRNGGITWDQFRTPSRATHSTQFLDLANGWTAAFAPREGGAEAVVYDTTLMRTENGGMSWRNDFIARGRRIRGVFFLSPTKGWAVGDRGMILSYEEKSKAN
ncbi:MAG: YCF48-related protein [Blastocatellia bacterium]